MSWKHLSDPKLKQNLIQRAKIVSLVRDFFVSQGFLEIETPIMVPYAGQEPYLNPLKTNFQDNSGKNYSGYLVTSPEYSMKKLLAAGYEKIFSLGKVFRGNEPIGGTHNTEFTMIEWYRTNADYFALMDDCENMFKSIASKLLMLKTFVYQNKTIDISSQWQRLTMREAWKKYVPEIDPEKIIDGQYLREFAIAHGYEISAPDSYDDVFFKIFLTKIEPDLGIDCPTFLYEYPAQMAGLAKRKEDEPAWSERVELYIGGLELANGFSELTDTTEQRARFLEEQEIKKKLNKEIIPLDEDFLNALSHMPPCAGIALGIDRLVMLMTDAATITEVTAFPTNRLWN